MIASGHVTKGPRKFTERLVALALGARVIPFDVTGELTIIGTIITNEGAEGVACFDRSSLSVATTVDINYAPPQVEAVEVNTGSGVTPADMIAIAKAVWDFPATLVVVSGSVGEYLIKQLLTFKQFIGLK